VSIFLPLYEENSSVHHKFTIFPLAIVQGAMLYLLIRIEETHHGGVVARGICRAGHSQHLGGAAAWLDRNNETHVQHLLLYVGLFFSRNFTEGVRRRI